MALGIGGYDLKSSADRIFAFDYDSSGKLDHLALYRPGTGTMWILKNTAGVFAPVYAQGAPGNGIGGYDLKSPADLAFAFDYDHSGKLDHLVLYRPGTGTMWILKNTAGVFAPVYAQGAPGNGIGGYDLKSPADRAFAFDYDSSGKLDHIALYRPGTGTIWILKNTAGVFAPVYAQGAPGNGIGGYDLKSPADLAFAFDYNSTSKLDHLALYRPGTGTMWILKNTAGAFAPVYAQGDPGNGIGGYDLKSAADRAFAFDYDSSGKLDHLSLYRPGTGTFWILKNAGGNFGAVYAEGDPGTGIGGYDLKSPADLACAFDYDSSGKQDHLVLYRPGTGAIFILKNLGPQIVGQFSQVFSTGLPPTITGFSPPHGPVGTPVLVVGTLFWGPQVTFNGLPAKIVGAVSSIAVHVNVPAGAHTGPITITTHGGNWSANSPTNFVVDQPVTFVTVPSLINQSLQSAVSLLQQAGLVVGTVSGATGFSLVVVGQSPAAGARAARGSAVNLTVAAAASGFGAVTLANNLASEASVYVWLYNESTAKWGIQNSGAILAFGSNTTFSLQSGSVFVVEAVDPTMCGGANDPTNTDCIAWSQGFVGLTGGPTYVGQMN